MRETAVSLLLLTFFAVMTGVFLYTITLGAPYVGTRRRDIADMLTLAKIQPGEHVFDLGSGDGRLLVAAARQGARVTGYEINPLLAALSAWRVRGRGRIRLKSLLRADLSQADVVLVYTMPHLLAKLEPRLRRQLPPGARVVVNSMRFPTWEADAERGNARLYRVQ